LQKLINKQTNDSHKGPCPSTRPKLHSWRETRAREVRGHAKVYKVKQHTKKGMGKENTASALKQWNNGDGEGPVIHIQMHEDTLVSGCDYAGS